jgi:hypothetical protein
MSCSWGGRFRDEHRTFMERMLRSGFKPAEPGLEEMR